MRREPMPTACDEELAGYTFFFQIASDGGRRACRVKVAADNIHEASALFRRNWSVIELMARDSVTRGDVSDGVMTIVMP